MAGRLYAGVSGFSYPTWRGDFYPSTARAPDFLRLYAERLPSVELNATGRRLPRVEQLERWAAMTPPSFRFAVKLTTWIPFRLEAAPVFCAAVGALGERLGPVLVQLPPLGRHDQELLEGLVASLDGSLAYAVELKDEAWNATAVAEALAGLRATLVGELESPAPFRYLRLREPPYGEETLAVVAEKARGLLAGGIDVYAYFKHEDEPTAPRYARRLIQLASS